VYVLLAAMLASLPPSSSADDEQHDDWKEAPFSRLSSMRPCSLETSLSLFGFRFISWAAQLADSSQNVGREFVRRRREVVDRNTTLVLLQRLQRGQLQRTSQHTIVVITTAVNREKNARARAGSLLQQRGYLAEEHLLLHEVALPVGHPLGDQLAVAVEMHEHDGVPVLLSRSRMSQLNTITIV
jgi:hypothetical protein